LELLLVLLFFVAIVVVAVAVPVVVDDDVAIVGDGLLDMLSLPALPVVRFVIVATFVQYKTPNLFSYGMLQVDRETRLKKNVPGTGWNDQERSKTDLAALEFVRSRERTESQRKRAKTEANNEHLKSWDFLCRLQNALGDWTENGVDQFFKPGPLPLCEVLSALFLCMDLLQSQWRVL